MVHNRQVEIEAELLGFRVLFLKSRKSETDLEWEHKCAKDESAGR